MTNATSNLNHLRNSNFGSGRQSIIDKYDKNGDGKIDLDELHGFVDDYILSINNNNTLLDSNANLRKMIGIGLILILILSLSNLGTAILAANISKEAVIVDGRFVTNDGSAKTISTMITVESVTKTWELQHQDPRNLAEDGADSTTTDTTTSQFTCFTQEEVDAIFATAMSGTGTNLIMQSVEDDGSISQTVVSIHGTGLSSRGGVSFPDSNVELVRDDTGLCKESRRKLKNGDDEDDVLKKMKVYVYRYKKTMEMYCESEVNKFTALTDCTASDPLEIGNGVCNVEHNTQECEWDDGDCDLYNSLVLAGCMVPARFAHSLGDGICDAPYNTEACGWDGGDCPTGG